MQTFRKRRAGLSATAGLSCLSKTIHRKRNSAVRLTYALLATGYWIVNAEHNHCNLKYRVAVVQCTVQQLCRGTFHTWTAILKTTRSTGTSGSRGGWLCEIGVMWNAYIAIFTQHQQQFEHLQKRLPTENATTASVYVTFARIFTARRTARIARRMLQQMV